MAQERPKFRRTLNLLAFTLALLALASWRLELHSHAGKGLRRVEHAARRLGQPSNVSLCAAAEAQRLQTTRPQNFVARMAQHGVETCCPCSQRALQTARRTRSTCYCLVMGGTSAKPFPTQRFTVCRASHVQRQEPLPGCTVTPGAWGAPAQHGAGRDKQCWKPAGKNIFH